jgi:adenylosuccinate lyase
LEYGYKMKDIVMTKSIGEKFSYPDVLAQRYATAPIVNTWSPYYKVILERRLWVAAMKAQRALGVRIPAKAIKAYERAILTVDLESIKKRELVTKQDVKARIEEFNALAGYEFCHGGFTSRDLTDNTEQLQIRDSLIYVRDRTVAILARFGHNAAKFQTLDICGRSHNVPGQTITLGKRFSNFSEEMLAAFNHLLYIIDSYPLRGIKGPMGTQQDMVTLLGSPQKAALFERRIAEHLGFKNVLDSTGQVYPRSLDLEVLSVLVQLSGACGNFAKMVRLMAGMELAHEGFREGQTASSAMPHKINSRTCERMNGFIIAIGGFEDMVKGLVGDQWFEGDVSCSLVRRIALPGAFFSIDGLFESVLTVLDEMEVFPTMVEQELQRYLPFLSSTRILMEAFKAGMGRENAHKIIKKHAMETRRNKGFSFLKGIASEPGFPLSESMLEKLVVNPDHGLSVEQTEKVCKRISTIVRKYPEAASYQPQPLL